MTSPTSPHWNRMRYLKDRIHDRQMLRDAQVQNSVGYQGFQREIDHLTRELLRWENNIAQINGLEATITSVDSAAQASWRNASYIAGHWWRLAVGSGFIGALLLLLSLKWSLSPQLLWTGAALLALAGGARAAPRNSPARRRLGTPWLIAARKGAVTDVDCAVFPPGTTGRLALLRA